MLRKLMGKRVYILGAALAAMVATYLIGELRSAHSEQWKTNWDKRSISLNELTGGGPPKDGIPSIDNPVFITPEKAAAWLEGREPVISLTINGDARAYPLQILIWHELVNDEVGGVPVLVSF